jgi:phage tail sheath protein FI
MLARVKGNMSTARPVETLVASPESPPSSPIKMIDSPVSVTATGSDGIDVTKVEYQGNEINKTGLWALKNEEFNLLCIPPPTRDTDTDPDVYSDGLKICVDSRAMLLVDSPASWGEFQAPALAVNKAIADLGTLNISGTNARNAALFFPRVRQSDPKRDGQVETFVPCGIIAGVMARTDTSRGVWKSPAGIDASLNGIQALQINLSDDQNGQLNPLAINCLRAFPVTGRVVWGSRTMRGADEIADEYKYIAVRRTALFIEESLYRGTKWVVFEPNDEPLWAQIRLNVGAFMHNLFRQGAFQGMTPKDAYLVKCDRETTTQNDINLGIVNILVGFAPLKPAEFVIIKIQQLTGQIES